VVTSVTVDSRDSKIAYVTFSGYGSPHVFKTTEGGARWADISGAPGALGSLPNIPVNALAIDPKDPRTLYVGTDVGVYRSTRGGGSWVEFNNGMPPTVVHSFAFGSDGRVLAASFGRGVYELAAETRR
jgi:photosystem II stability/assembly factor-like uncharacterized protein